MMWKGRGVKRWDSCAPLLRRFVTSSHAGRSSSHPLVIEDRVKGRWVRLSRDEPPHGLGGEEFGVGSWFKYKARGRRGPGQGGPIRPLGSLKL